MFLIGIYGGYFGAAAGVMLLAVLLVATDDTLARSNALKNVLLAIANVAAALGFIVLGGPGTAAPAPACSPGCS